MFTDIVENVNRHGRHFLPTSLKMFTDIVEKFRRQRIKLLPISSNSNKPACAYGNTTRHSHRMRTSTKTPAHKHACAY